MIADTAVEYEAARGLTLECGLATKQHGELVQRQGSDGENFLRAKRPNRAAYRGRCRVHGGRYGYSRRISG